jgi:polar amino acid transport system substrate-binding protein
MRCTQKEASVKKLLVGMLLAVTIMVSGCVTPHSNLRIITEENPPFNFTDETGNITGQSTELVRQIMKATASQATLEVLPWSQGYTIVQKDAGSAIYSTNRIASRESFFKWVGPIGTADNWFYAKAGAGIAINSLEDARKVKAIAVYQDDSNQLYLSQQGFTNLDISLNDTECIKKLVGGQVALWLGPAEGLDFIAYRAGVNPAEIQPVKYVRRSEWYVAFNKETPESTVQAWQKALDDLKKPAGGGGMSIYEDIVTSYALPHYAAAAISKEVVMKLADQAATDLAADTPGTIAKINGKNAPYLSRDNPELYVYVFDKYTKEVANADNPSVVGRNFRGVPDMAGKLFRDNIVDGALAKGVGWEDYVFTMPGKIGLFYKSAYYKSIIGSDGKQYIVCAGRYKAKGE